MSGAIAAAKIRQLINFEEEELTKYSEEELHTNWEFKIVRSLTGAFKHPMKLQEVINNEKQYGWQLVEKFDNHRIRFKRKANNQTEINFFNDPYKIYYGIGPVSFSLLITFITLFGTGLLIGIIIFFTKLK